MEAKEQSKSALKRRDMIMISSGAAFQPFRYSVGVLGSRFFTELRVHKRFLGLRCPGCKKVYVPPRPVCGPCFLKLKPDWIPVGPGGTITAFTILRFAFIDPETGKQKPVPYGYGFIKLNGASTNFQHFLRIDAKRPLKIGMRVTPVFEDVRNGNLRDIRHFEAI